MTYFSIEIKVFGWLELEEIGILVIWVNYFIKNNDVNEKVSTRQILIFRNIFKIDI